MSRSRMGGGLLSGFGIQPWWRNGFGLRLWRRDEIEKAIPHSGHYAGRVSKEIGQSFVLGMRMPIRIVLGIERCQQCLRLTRIECEVLRPGVQQRGHGAPESVLPVKRRSISTCQRAMAAIVSTGKLPGKGCMRWRVVEVRQVECPPAVLAGKTGAILFRPGHFLQIGIRARLVNQCFVPRRLVVVLPGFGGRYAPLQPKHFEPPAVPAVPGDAKHARIGQPSAGGAEVACHLLQRLLRYRQLERRIGRRARDVRVVAQEGADLAGRAGFQAQRGCHQRSLVGAHLLREHGPAGKASVPIGDGRAPEPHAPVCPLASEKSAWRPSLMPLDIRGRRQC